jgi:predicted transcriptional regulator of viral defense system
MSGARLDARAIFRERGLLRTGEALAAGIHRRTLYALRDSGGIESVGRGVFRISGLPPLSNPDLALVAKRVRAGVICLISALAFYDLTTQIPHAVHVALPRSARRPRLSHPPLRVYRFSRPTFEAGVEVQEIDGVRVRIYSAEKTLADCFKYRHKIGMDVVLEALHAYRQRRGPRFQAVLEYARLCRVENVIRPYLEAVA